jgi:hypothetical protein
MLFPEPVELGDVGLEVVADCSGATTRKSGQSLLEYGIDTDLENAPINDQPFVILRAEFDARFDKCVSPGRKVDVKVQWGLVGDDNDADRSTIFAEEAMQLGSDGVYRVSIDTRRYKDELMTSGHYQTSNHRCDWGNG